MFHAQSQVVDATQPWVGAGLPRMVWLNYCAAFCCLSLHFSFRISLFILLPRNVSSMCSYELLIGHRVRWGWRLVHWLCHIDWQCTWKGFDFMRLALSYAIRELCWLPRLQGLCASRTYWSWSSHGKLLFAAKSPTWVSREHKIIGHCILVGAQKEQLAQIIAHKYQGDKKVWHRCKSISMGIWIYVSYTYHHVNKTFQSCVVDCVLLSINAL